MGFRRQQGAQGVRQGSGRVVAGLVQPGAAVQRRPVVVPEKYRGRRDRRAKIARVPVRLPDRKSAVGGQRVHLPADLYRVRRQARVPAPRADLRRARCDRDARRDDPGRRLGGERILVDTVCVWRVPAVHRPQDAQGGRRRAGREKQSRAALGAQGAARIGGRPRRKIPGHEKRQALRDHADAGADPDRGDRPDLCSRLDPGHLCHHVRPVHRVHVEYVCDFGPAGAVLPAGGRGRPLPPAQVWPGPGAVLHRRQDAAAAVVPHPGAHLADRGGRADR
uniref:Uncharacterized protein n=1 Tax=Tanacetum cinerariifolium TaxID=118510 RepID=A0A699GFM4_TANCI|nr:hypothetical protein [Tanacetum cinerariifolium]